MLCIDRTEKIPEADLFIVRQGIDPVLARDYEAELQGLTEDHLSGYSFGEVVSRSMGSEAPVHTQAYQTNILLSLRLPAISKVLELVDRRAGYIMTVNMQPPYSHQKFHTDSLVESPVCIVHGSDGGAFDYSTAPTEITAEGGDFIPVEVNAGDVVWQHNPMILHRGRNPSDSVRYNGVIYREVPEASVLKWLFTSQRRV